MCQELSPQKVTNTQSFQRNTSFNQTSMKRFSCPDGQEKSLPVVVSQLSLGSPVPGCLGDKLLCHPIYITELQVYFLNFVTDFHFFKMLYWILLSYMQC